MEINTVFLRVSHAENNAFSPALAYLIFYTEAQQAKRLEQHCSSIELKTKLHFHWFQALTNLTWANGSWMALAPLTTRSWHFPKQAHVKKHSHKRWLLSPIPTGQVSYMPEQHRIDFCILKQVCVITVRKLYILFLFHAISSTQECLIQKKCQNQWCLKSCTQQRGEGRRKGISY